MRKINKKADMTIEEFAKVILYVIAFSAFIFLMFKFIVPFIYTFVNGLPIEAQRDRLIDYSTLNKDEFKGLCQQPVGQIIRGGSYWYSLGLSQYYYIWIHDPATSQDYPTKLLWFPDAIELDATGANINVAKINYGNIIMNRAFIPSKYESGFPKISRAIQLLDNAFQLGSTNFICRTNPMQ